MLYHSKLKLSRTFLIRTTFVTPFSILLWGTNIRHIRTNEMGKEDFVIEVDGWLKFIVSERIAVLFKHLRRDINAVLSHKINEMRHSRQDTKKLANIVSDLLDIEVKCLHSEIR
mmetsp:Transcript_17918/g.26538  ORF Transcript_17918/g.26538 Transcript_17918/m.26538 type:complete len:114 (+) Transcript_17918:211-552(+)